MPPGVTAPPVERDRASEREIAAALRGEPVVPARPDAFVEMALRHRVAPLLVHAGMASRLPAAAASLLLESARDEAVLSELRDRELCRVLCRLKADGIDVLVVKGAHLGHGYYDASHLRPRDDADLLIDERDRDRAAAALAAAGYVHLPDITGGVVHGQMLFGRTENVPVVLDIHWRVAGPRVASDLLSFDELQRDGVALPRLGPCGRGPSTVHALALACIHQSAHHPWHDLLLWNYDIALLLSRLTQQEGDAFVALALERRMAHLCAHAVRESLEHFPSATGAALAARLDQHAAAEPTAFLIEPRTPLAQLASDLAATRGWASRGALLAGHLFPPAAYMRQAYGVSSATLLPLLYVHRIVRGSWRWITVRRTPPR